MFHNKSILTKATILASVLCVVSLAVSNQPAGISGEFTAIKYANIITRGIHSDVSIENDVLLIGVDYDKQLIPKRRSYGDTVGNTVVTDRLKLYKLLTALDSLEKSEPENSYKYIFLDLYFAPSDGSPYDSLLFERIASMKRIVTARPWGTESDIEKISAKSAPAQYLGTIYLGDFYKYIISGKENGKSKLSFAATAYCETTGSDITKTGPFWHQGKRLSRRCFVPVMYNWMSSTDEGETPVRNLGSSIIAGLESPQLHESTVNDFRDRYIVIGAFDGSDSHSTYIGSQPGCLVNFNAFRSMMNGNHIIYFSDVLVLFIYLFMMSLFSLYNVEHRSHKVDTLLGLFRNIVTLSLFVVFMYAVRGRTYDIIFTSTILSIIEYAYKKYMFHPRNTAK